jgi:hypothetical protein
MGVITRTECPHCGRTWTKHDNGKHCRGVMTVAEHEPVKWERVEYVRADILAGAVEDIDKLRRWIHRSQHRAVVPFGECRMCDSDAQTLDLIIVGGQ